MSKVTVSEDDSISISELQDGESFDVEVRDSDSSELFRYTISDGGSEINLTGAGIESIGNYSAKITKIIVVLPDGGQVGQHNPEETGEFTVNGAKSVEIRMKEMKEGIFNDEAGEVTVSAAETDITLRGTFTRQTNAAQIPGGINGGMPDPNASVLPQYDQGSQVLRLSGSFLFQENADSEPFLVSEVFVRSVDESAWVDIWKDWTANHDGTPDLGKALTISGAEIDSFPGENGGRIVIIDSDHKPFILAGAEGQASVIFSQASAAHTVSINRETDGPLVLQFDAPHLVTTGDTTWRFGAGEKLIITGFDEQTWDAAIKAGEIRGKFSIHGGTAQIKQDGTHQISGTSKGPVRLELDVSAAEEAEEVILIQHDGQTAETPAVPLIPLILGGAFIAACAVIAILAVRCRRLGNARVRESRDANVPATQNEPRPAALRVGRLQNIGSRPSQQDSMGVVSVQGGVFAVVADGMGGLSDGDKVSQKIVQTMLGDVSNRRADQIASHMAQLVAHANSEVNQMLGFSSQYKSGSTLLAVMAEPGRFHWIAVGDSRIYLYRGGSIIQMNHEHVLEMELVTKAVNRKISFQEARSNEKKKSVTSFIGMGELRYIDMSLEPVLLVPGDKILLMSDGVFNTLSEPELSRLLEANPDPAQAATAIEAGVLSRNMPHQDNFSCMIIDYS